MDRTDAHLAGCETPTGRPSLPVPCVLSTRSGPQLLTDYNEELDAARLEDLSTYERVSAGRLGLFLVWNLIVVAVLLPFAVIGVAVNFVPAALVWLVGRIPVAPAVLATIKPVAAISLFGITWGAWVWSAFMQWGLRGGVAMLLLMPIYLFAVIVVSERLVLLWRSVRWWFRSGRSQRLRDRIVGGRQRVIDAVQQALQ